MKFSELQGIIIGYEKKLESLETDEKKEITHNEADIIQSQLEGSRRQALSEIEDLLYYETQKIDSVKEKDAIRKIYNNASMIIDKSHADTEARDRLKEYSGGGGYDKICREYEEALKSED